MKQKYFINNSAQSNGDHEVHKVGCRYLAMAKDVTCLGEFETDQEAVRYARRIYKNADGCYFCCHNAHRS